MREIRTSGSMSGDGKRSVAAWPKLPRPSSTLPKRSKPIRQSCPQLAKADVGSNDDEDASTVARRILDLYLELNRRVGS